jgi:hypothetical protein
MIPRKPPSQVKPIYPEPVEEKEEEKPVIKTGFGNDGFTRSF